MERRAKIVATLGPASRGEEVLRGLVRAGADVFRLNLSHGTREEHRATLESVRRVAAEERLHLPVMLDLMGPRYRLGTIAGGPRQLRPDAEVTLGSAAAGADLPVDSPQFLDHLAVGERLLVDSGLVELRVVAREGGRVRTRVVNGGPVSTGKGINLPDTALPFEISGKDRSDIELAVEHQAEFLAASYVGQAADVVALRQMVEAAGGRIPIVAKLERATAIEHLEEITAAADAIMVARGDLGVEMPLHTVPVLQKRILEVGRRAGRPVIVATQMLESMIVQPRPTRAEASDVANGVLDGADALLLSGETAIGKYPLQVVETMSRIVAEAERYARATAAASPTLQPLGEMAARRAFRIDPPTGETEAADRGLEVPEMVSAAAVYAAGQVGASLIVAFSQSGFTARLVARYRPACPIIAFTPEPRVARQVQLVWGVRPLLAHEEVGTLDDVVQVVERQLLAAGLVQAGERILILMGHPIRERPLTNLMRVHRIRPA